MNTIPGLDIHGYQGGVDWSKGSDYSCINIRAANDHWLKEYAAKEKKMSKKNKKLRNKIDELYNQLDNETRWLEDRNEEQMKTIARLKDALGEGDSEGNVPSEFWHWFVPGGDYICTVGGVEYIIIDRELFHKDKERMD